MLKNILKTYISLKRLLFIFIFITIILVINSSSISADDFHASSGDINNCNLALTDTVSIHKLPKLDEKKFTYDKSLVKGDTNYISTHRFTPHLGSLTSPDAVRYSGVADNIQVPPNTEVEIGYYTHNYSGHDIKINKAYLFTSQTDTTKGDWTRLGASGNTRDISWIEGGKIVTRKGKVAEINLNSTAIQDSSTKSSLGKKLYSFKTIQPIQILDKKVNYEFDKNSNLILLYKVDIKNISSYSLKNINLIETFPNNTKFDKKFNFSPNEHKHIKYQVNLGKDHPNIIDIPELKVIDPNMHTEVTTSPNQTSLIIQRDDSTNTNWFGNQTSYNTDTERMKITLIPYTIYSHRTKLEIPPKLEVIKTVSDKDEKEVKENKSQPNEDITYKIVVKNTGGVARDVNVIDDYDEENISIIEALDATQGDGYLKWNLEKIYHNQSLELVVKAKIKKDYKPGKYIFNNYVKVEHRDNPELIDIVQTEVEVIEPTPNIPDLSIDHAPKTTLPQTGNITTNKNIFKGILLILISLSIGGFLPYIYRKI